MSTPFTILGVEFQAANPPQEVVSVVDRFVDEGGGQHRKNFYDFYECPFYRDAFIVLLSSAHIRSPGRSRWVVTSQKIGSLFMSPKQLMASNQMFQLNLHDRSIAHYAASVAQAIDLGDGIEPCISIVEPFDADSIREAGVKIDSLVETSANATGWDVTAYVLTPGTYYIARANFGIHRHGDGIPEHLSLSFLEQTAESKPLFM